MRAIIVAFHAGALALTFKPALFRKCKKYGGKSKMSARRHFWWGRYPPVFADVGERNGVMDGVRVSRGNIGLPAFARKRRFGGFTERHTGRRIRIWVMGLAMGRERFERAVQGRRRWENAQKDI